MTNQLPPIYFYIPQSDWSTDYPFPEHISDYWSWQQAMKGSRGIFNWTVQAYLNLKAIGFNTQLTGTIPPKGIVVVHRDGLPDEVIPGSELLLICIQADKARHPYAQIHIVQNPQEDMLKNPSTLWESYHIPLWSQAGLIPRNPDRGIKFENIAFFGRERELAPELLEPSWSKRLEALRLSWQIVNSSHWNDYSWVDATLAVRNFQQPRAYNWKPASKLINSWQAGVPAILGPESAFQAKRQSDLDYIEVTSVEEALEALLQLRDDVELRAAMVANGYARAEETRPERIAAKWRSFFLDIAVPAYDRWSHSSRWQQQSFFLQREWNLKTKRIRSQILRARGQLVSPIKYLIKDS